MAEGDAVEEGVIGDHAVPSVRNSMLYYDEIAGRRCNDTGGIGTSGEEDES